MVNNRVNRKLRMGMVGGGQGAFIGEVHRIAAQLDNQIELVCGAFSSDAAKSKESGRSLFLPENRVYGSFQEMIERERELPEGERMDFVSIVTPNHVHFGPAMLALESGFHVVLDKPMTFDLAEAKQLKQKVDETGLLFLLTHTYVGYPMVRQARQLVRDGALGKIRKIYVEYPQGWLSREQDNSNKQASWRTDPSKSGKAGCMGDIGTHALHLAEFISGLQTTQLCASLYTYVEGRKLDDDGNVLLQFDNGASGVLIASQVAAGEENALKIRVYGENGGLEWHQQEPNTLQVRWLDKPTQIYRANGAGLSAEAASLCRTPAGHPEGYLEAFANLYKLFANALRAKLSGEEDTGYDFPSVDDGVRGMAFLDNVVNSSESNEKWTPFTV
ncbi:Gfo/Idh/MocA family protein [Parapedobacter indicus]|uniref:Predicted dehydrogenase n=1 Tax=Parapedobacter indicus TaxID=1477437 RepID=A0A1I3NRN2_9SPHI|nr:Gfo/Idh/MocA family oxidoreductase [Parapedobacter indicus]PPL01070.1 putative dehydrogenase [Parapedobacter indicus]SFJ11968.1 Predicted dehydrogenase [Parapedobacter indicus]